MLTIGDRDEWRIAQWYVYHLFCNLDWSDEWQATAPAASRRDSVSARLASRAAGSAEPLGRGFRNAPLRVQFGRP